MSVITGFADLDYMLNGGFQKGCLYFLAGRPAMGKTGLAINMIDNICFNQHRIIAYFSLEMSKRQLLERILAFKAKIESYVLRTGNIEKDGWNRIAKAAEAMSKASLIIDDTSAADVETIRTKCVEYRKSSEDLSAIFIDYLQLVSVADNNKSRKKQISEIVKQLKGMAVELDCPIVVISQISRESEYREDHRPVISDLVEGDAISQYADVIMFLYRDEYYDRSASRGIAEVIVSKNAGGYTGTIELGFQADYVKFENMHN
ncbi:replicative DNA helicase [Lachnospiraceae bacterium XBB1006]|nr:replicative DNA helicase [Lachnospiraceae bacterium XBB1006]